MWQHSKENASFKQSSQLRGAAEVISKNETEHVTNLLV